MGYLAYRKQRHRKKSKERIMASPLSGILIRIPKEKNGLKNSFKNFSLPINHYIIQSNALYMIKSCGGKLRMQNCIKSLRACA